MNKRRRRLQKARARLLRGLEIGFDVDVDNGPQPAHYCWPYAMRRGALCGSPRLWFSFPQMARAFQRGTVTCPECLRLGAPIVALLGPR
jgi:hypothetical protein